MIWAAVPTKVMWVGRARTLAFCIVAVLVAASLGMLLTAKPAHAKTFTVNSKANPGSGGCTASECTLKEAINEANANGESDAISFARGLSGEIDLHNTATKGGFSILNDTPAVDLAIIGPGAGVLAINGNNETRAFGIASGAEATIAGLTIKNGKAHDSSVPKGGGIASSGTLRLSNTTVRGNTATSTAAPSAGGGIHNTGTMTLENTTVSGNTATSTSTFGSRFSSGGGIHNSGTMTLDGTTVSGNTATSTAATSVGGGIHNTGAMTLTNTTVSGNTAARLGGGIENGGPLTLIHVTLNRNSAPSAANLGQIGGEPVMRATIIANPRGGGYNCDIGADENLRGYNLEYPGISCFLEMQGNPKLALLAKNGGPTKTHALQAGSAAIDQVPSGNDPLCPPPFTDQRGVFRPQDGDGNGDSPDCDIGAYEKKKPR